MIELMKKLPREQDVSVAILRWAGRAVAARAVTQAAWRAGCSPSA